MLYGVDQTALWIMMLKTQNNYFCVFQSTSSCDKSVALTAL